MIRTALFLFPALLAVGCYDEDKFADDSSTAFCDKMTECEADAVAAYVDLGLDEATAQSTFDTAYTAACETEADDTDDTESDCDFDSAAAKDCVAGIEDMSCDFFSTGTGYPDVCADVCGAAAE